MFMWKFFLSLTLAFLATASTIQAQTKLVQLSQQDALTALQQVASAGQTLNYTGVFVIQKGDHFETCRITHYGSGPKELEKIVRLDGDPLEITRVDDDILVYVPDEKYLRSKVGIQ